MQENAPAQLGHLLNHAAALGDTGRLREALHCYDQAIAIDPGHADVFCNRGNVLADMGQLDLAIASYDHAIRLDESHAEALDFRGIALFQLGHLQPSLESFDRALALNPDNPNTLGNRGTVLMTLGQREEALRSFDRALALVPDFVAAHNNRGNLLAELDRPDEAVASFDRAIALQPDLIDAHRNRGLALATLGRFEEALAGQDRAIALAPNHADAHNDRGTVLAALGRHEQAIRSFERAIAIDPGHAVACFNAAREYGEMRRPAEAVALYRRAVALAPRHADAFNNLGAALRELGRLREAVESFDAAIAISPDEAVIHYNRACALNDLDALLPALDGFDHALALDPALPNALSMRLFVGLHLCDWKGFEEQRALVARHIEQGDRVIGPGPLLALCDDPELQRRCAEMFAEDNFASAPATPIVRHPRHDTLRIGYFSADFHAHSTMQLIAEMIEHHDRDRFSIHAFSFGPDKQDAWRRRAVDAFESFHDVRFKSDREVAEMARAMQIDIAIDLKGLAQDYRTGIFAERAAPIQASYLAYPGTMGCAFLDYLIADDVVVPEDARGGYSEKIAYLDGCYQANCRELAIGQTPPSRADLGLPARGFVYCCFNQAYKITPDIFEIWMAVLGQVDGSVLWLWVEREPARDNLRAEAMRHGIDPARLIFADRAASEAHLARLPLADLFLDTLPYNAHTTASDALRMGLPVLTRAGRSFAGRVAASLLTAIGLPELITTDRAGYQAMAIELGSDSERMAAIRRTLADAVPSASLFDGQAFARKIEAVYLRMFERYRNGEQPAHITREKVMG